MTADGKTPTKPEAPDPRPRPAYGEYAPEGWEWTPPGETPAPSASSPSPSASAQRSGGNAPSGASSAPPSLGSGRLPGVPHNLGARGSTSPGAAEVSRPASEPDDAKNSQHYRAAPGQQGAPRAAGGGRLGDRIITIVLLVVGALGALNSAASLYSMPETLQRFGEILGLEGLVVPAEVGTLGLVGALVIFAIYALNLVYSLQRLRAKKLTFWVPLVAAVLSVLVSTAVSFTAFTLVPELLQAASDPSALQTLMDALLAQ